MFSILCFGEFSSCTLMLGSVKSPHRKICLSWSLEPLLEHFSARDSSKYLYPSRQVLSLQRWLKNNQIILYKIPENIFIPVFKYLDQISYQISSSQSSNIFIKYRHLSKYPQYLDPSRQVDLKGSEGEICYNNERKNLISYTFANDVLLLLLFLLLPNLLSIVAVVVSASCCCCFCFFFCSFCHHCCLTV